MKNKNIKLKFVIKLLLIIWIIYSFIGIIASSEYVKPNGNVCRGYKYGWKICGGDINAE